MRFEAIYSSSKSNLYIVTAGNGKRLLIECGCTPKQFQKAVGYKLDGIVGCLVTHCHDDHSHCIEFVLDSEIDVYASLGTFEALGVVHRKAHVIRDKERFVIDKTFEVFPFDEIHDVAEPLGFKIKEISSKEELLFATDTMLIKPRFGVEFSIICLGCNYDGEILSEMVDSGDINEFVAKRINDNHLSVYATLDYLRRCCCLDKCHEIWLLHMSGSNIDKEKTRAEVETELCVPTYVAGGKEKT